MLGLRQPGKCEIERDWDTKEMSLGSIPTWKVRYGFTAIVGTGIAGPVDWDGADEVGLAEEALGVLGVGEVGVEDECGIVGDELEGGIVDDE